MFHGNRGRPPANRTGQAVREQVIALRRKKYDRFNDAHFADKLLSAEKLLSEEGVAVKLAVRTVRRILREAGIAPVRRRRARRHRRRRERKAQAGLMLLWDGSPHAWLEQRGPQLCLVGAIDDANDHTFPLDSKLYQVMPHPALHALRGKRVEICQSLRGGMEVYYKMHRLRVRPAPQCRPRIFPLPPRGERKGTKQRTFLLGQT